MIDKTYSHQNLSTCCNCLFFWEELNVSDSQDCDEKMIMSLDEYKIGRRVINYDW